MLATSVARASIAPRPPGRLLTGLVATVLGLFRWATAALGTGQNSTNSASSQVGPAVLSMKWPHTRSCWRRLP